MRVISFNINGLRARLHQLAAVIERHRPDIIALQETKVSDAEFPQAAIDALGYHVVYHGQKGHYGVALLSRVAPRQVECGFSGDGAEAQCRLIRADYPLADGGELSVINGYFPQGESRDHPVKFPAKQKFYRDLRQLLDADYDPARRLIVTGDLNVSPADIDIGIGEENRKRWLRRGKCSFLPEERAWFAELLAWGLQDSYRVLHPDRDDLYSWFDYRSRGFEQQPRRGLRIDLLLATPGMIDRLQQVGIDYDIRGMERPSDHCPVWASFDCGVGVQEG